MLEHYKLASTNISATYKPSEKVVVIPHEYLESLFDKKIKSLSEDHEWIIDLNIFDQKFIELCQE
jgi:hypothetical protein